MRPHAVLPRRRPSGDTVAEEPTDVLAIHRDIIPEMIRECPRVTAILVHAMLDRARHFTSSDLHDEKLLSLGKLAAGLAHELNNPASAAARSAKMLAASFAESEEAARALAAARLSDAQLAEVDRVRGLCESGTAPALRSPIERADREEALAAWFDAHGFDADYAAALAETSVDRRRRSTRWPPRSAKTRSTRRCDRSPAAASCDSSPPISTRRCRASTSWSRR